MSEKLGRRWQSGHYREKDDLLFWRVETSIQGGGKTVRENMNEYTGNVKIKNMEKWCPSETSKIIYELTRHKRQDDLNLNQLHRERPKTRNIFISYTVM